MQEPFKHFDGDAQEWLTERAAILEYDAGLSRPEAEAEAVMLWRRLQIDDRE